MMILKNIDEKRFSNDKQKYGHEAEKQMAFYLKRTFQNEKDIYVLNDLRLQLGDDVAQIDHLVVHEFGFVIVESKSVTSKISINAFGEWTRHYPNNSKGMPSPILQAQMQLELLKQLLSQNSENLLKKKLFLQADILDFKFDLLVAISDNGIIERSDGANISTTVYKADQIPLKILDIISGYKKENSLFRLSLKVNYHFLLTTLEKVARFLLHEHVSKEEFLPQKSCELEQKRCRNCHSAQIEILYGHSYYFKCKDCGYNTKINLQCIGVDCKPRLRKEQTKFYKECPTCGTSTLYFENIVLTDKTLHTLAKSI